MDVLWQRQKHLYIILQTLPARCRTITGQGHVSGNGDKSRPSRTLNLLVFQSVNRAPTADEWRRFRRYAARVVTLFVGGWRFVAVTPETISFFGLQSTLDPLWPRLTSLRLADGLSWDAIPFILTFLSPRVTSLTLTLPRDDSVLLQPLLSIASDKCRWLQELVLDVVTLDALTINVVKDLIFACQDTLRTLNIRSPFWVGCLPIIANLPQLRSLRLWGVYDSCDPPSNAFPSLEEVIILRFRGNWAQHFLKHLRTTRLKVVKIHGIDTTAFKVSTAALSRFLASLEVLEISGVGSLDFPSAVVPHPLFTNLRTLYVGCLHWGDGTHLGPCAFQATGQAVAELGAAIPSIARLTLGNPTCPNLNCVTFLSLVSLSKTCQDLETLMIGVDFRSMVGPSPHGSETDVTSGRTQSSLCKLRRLVFGLSTLPAIPDSEWVVAVGLEKIFPSLSEVVGSEQGNWEKVGEKIEILRRLHRTIQL